MGAVFEADRIAAGRNCQASNPRITPQAPPARWRVVRPAVPSYGFMRLRRCNFHRRRPCLRPAFRRTHGRGWAAATLYKQLQEKQKGIYIVRRLVEECIRSPRVT